MMFPSQEAPTIFVDNLPVQIRKIWVYNLFSRFGKIRDIFIPFKKSKITGRKFGFVRFYNSKEASFAISNVDRTWWWDHLLVVKYARFLKDQDRQIYHQQSHIREIKRNFPSDQRYNYGVNSKNPQFTHPLSPKRLQESRLHEKFLQPYRIVGGSEKRGKEIWRRKGTVETSKQGEARNKDSDNQKVDTSSESIIIQPSGNGWLGRSAVAKLRRLVSIQNLLEIFGRKKIDNIQIKSMGGRFFIITFPNDKERDEVIREKWLEYWFEELKPWNNEPAQVERFVWLGCYGMPLNTWNVSTFRTIGNRWGLYMDVDENTLREVSYEKGRVLIVTTEENKIKGQVQLVVNGRKFIIKIEEEESFRSLTPDFLCSVSDSNNIADDAEENSSDRMEAYVDMKAQSCKDMEIVNNDQENLGTNGRIEKGEDSLTVETNGIVEVVEDTLEMEGQLAKGKNSNIIFNDNYSYAEALRKPAAHTNVMVENLVEVVEKNVDVAMSAKLVPNNDIVDELEVEIVNETPVENRSENKVDEVDAVEESPNKVDAVEIDEDQLSSWSELPFHRKLSGTSKKKVVAEKIKRRKKSIEKLIGFPNSKKGGRKTKKSVLVRSAIASAALSISSEGIRNRNKLILNEEEAALAISKIVGEDYMGEDEEVISKLMTNNL